MAAVLLYIGAGLAIVWGTAHLITSKSVVTGFGDISGENRFIITQEWIAEGISTIFIGLLVLLITALEGTGNPASLILYRSSAGFLIVVAALTAVTGSRAKILPFKICPFLLTTVAILFLLGSFL
jgi:hypothetical protein